MPKTPQIIRVLGEFVGPPERYYDLTDMPWKEASELRAHLKNHGFFVQNIFMDDLMQLRVGIEIAKRDEEAREEKVTK